MKRLKLLLLALIGVLSMNAKVVTEQEARQKAQRFMQGKRSMQGKKLNQSQTQTRRVKQKNVPAYYIFNVEHEDGFVIVSGDDRTSEIFGYSEHGNLNPDNAPDNVKWWLSEYERQMEWLLNSADEGAVRRAAETSHRDGWTAIEPLVKSQWDQGAPYNDLCPTVDGVRTYTGCVATAMAQIMNYHQWPVTGTGSNSYEWNGQTLGMDFSSVTFDWGNMQDTYSYNGEDDCSEAKDAVATLMYACGIGLYMDYGIDASGAILQYVDSALCKNFGYDANLADRSDYGLSDWENIIYTDLANKRPVHYSGRLSSTAGHSFVCDGYSYDGLFHINWGWGGWCDGYFLLSVLDPYGEEDGFSFYQAIVHGICPVQEASIDGLHYNLSIDDGDGIAVVIPSDEGYYTGDIVISSTVTYEGKAYNVTKIADGTFSGCTSLTSLKIDDGVKFNIEPDAFMDNTFLTSVVLGNGVTSIGGAAFYNCTSLTSIVIPKSVTSIGNLAFKGCSSLTSIDLPEGVTSIGEATFSNCTSLTSINIPESVTSIGRWAFNGCSSLTSIDLPEGVTNIEYSAFSWCTSLTSINLPAGVTSIGDYAFNFCTSLTSIDLPEGVTNIGDGTFSGCEALTSIDLPAGVTSIGNGAFNFCTSLASIVIPNSVTSIGDDAFSCCFFTSIDIPERVASIGDRAFMSCTSLMSIDIHDSMTSIGYAAFSGCTSLTSVVLGNGVTSIGGAAFNGCSSLTSIDIPGSVTSIGDAAFSWCSGLTSVILGNGVTSIGDEAFYQCTSLMSVNIPGNVTSIGNEAFFHCTSLTSVNIPNSVTSIGHDAFAACNSLTSVYSLIENPFDIPNDVFGSSGRGATLYVPQGTKSAYEATAGWADSFKEIVEFDDVTGITATLARQAETDAVYDLNGTKVNVKNGDLKSLPRGIYVVNGKKTIVK